METTKNIFEETVKLLTEDALSLQKKFKKLQENNNFRGAIDCMRLMKDTLSLIKEYDWQTMYSEYSTNGHKEIAVWEQNHCGKIKNHKKWNVNTSKSPIYIDFYEKENGTVIVHYDGLCKRFGINRKVSNEKIPLYDFLKNMDTEDYDIFLDNHGFGLAIQDILDGLNVKYTIMPIQ